MEDPSAAGNPSRAEADRFDLDRGLAGLGLGHPRLRLRDRRRSIPQLPFHLVLHRGRVSPGALSGRHTSNPDGSWMTQQARNFVAGAGTLSFRFLSGTGTRNPQPASTRCFDPKAPRSSARRSGRRLRTRSTEWLVERCDASALIASSSSDAAISRPSCAAMSCTTPVVGLIDRST
jgi:hypothetical protein